MPMVPSFAAHPANQGRNFEASADGMGAQDAHLQGSVRLPTSLDLIRGFEDAGLGIFDLKLVEIEPVEHD
jgi:hypothetical protein